MPSPQKKYTTLVSNTLLFAISNFSSKLLSFFIRPYLSYARKRMRRQSRFDLKNDYRGKLRPT